jgi:hypothetical protein
VDFSFDGRVVEWRGPAPYYYVDVPVEVSADIRELAAGVSYGWGVVPVQARLGTTSFTTSLFPRDGRYLLPLKDAVRRASGVALDDLVSVQVQLRSRGA